jgi:hypothetical protein
MGRNQRKRQCLIFIVVVSALCAEVEPQARLYTKSRHYRKKDGQSFWNLTEFPRQLFTVPHYGAKDLKILAKAHGGRGSATVLLVPPVLPVLRLRGRGDVQQQQKRSDESAHRNLQH